MAEEILDNLSNIDNETLEQEILATLKKNQKFHLGILVLLFACWVCFLIRSHNMLMGFIIMKINYGQEDVFVGAMVLLMGIITWCIIKFSNFFAYPDTEQWQKTHLPQQVLIAFAAVFAAWRAIGEIILFNQLNN